MGRKANAIYDMKTKMAFIDTIKAEQHRDIAMACFRDTSSFEVRAGRDLCTFSGEEETDAIKAVMSTMLRDSTRVLAAKILSDYYKWCVKTGVPGAVEHEPIKEEVINAVNRDLLIFSPAHLQTILDRIFEREAEETVDNTYRCFYWMAYAGLSIDSIIMLKPEHFDLKSFLVSVNGEHGILYQQGIPCIENCINMSQFRYKHPLYSNVIMKDRIPGEYVLRGTRGTYDGGAIAYKNVTTLLSKRVRDAGVTLGYHTCYYSGLFYRIHEQELCYGMDPDFMSIALETPAGKRVMSSESVRKTSRHDRIYHIALKLKKDYQIWKSELQKR